MKQVFIADSGDVILRKVSEPKVGKGRVLVQVHYSAISTGTEVAEIDHRRANPGGDDIPLGYSLTGVVIQVGDGVEDIRKGDLVACGGWNISFHAEVVSVPKNYCVVLPSGSNLKTTSFSTIAAISLQSVRLAHLGIGEVTVVIGTGIIGQFAAALSRLSGARTIVIGYRNKMRLDIAHQLGAERVALSSEVDPIELVNGVTDGFGADAVLHCGKTDDNISIVQALEMVREKGTVVLVGGVPIDLPRAPLFRKELNFIVSRSTGPGRYDHEYEFLGVDYPPAYVRWTGRRNLAECARLINSGSLEVETMITHEFGFNDAPEAFDLLSNQGSKTLGVVFTYKAAKK
ncbi:MAG: zinc-binding dehydrogenase [Anaerolineales bacterium]|nr:zinc-binding dehydrogenase [Anaerolineales bacterium]